LHALNSARAYQPEHETQIANTLAIKRQTSVVVEKLAKSRTAAQEIIILLCARLDSLANMAFSRMTQEERFARFLFTYSGERQLFESVSIPDLYFFLRFQSEVLPGTIEKPGRIHVFTEDNLYFVRVLWNSGLAIDLRSARSLLRYLHQSLSTNFSVNCKHGRLPRLATVSKVNDCRAN